MTFKTTLQNIVNTVEKIRDISSISYVGSDGLFDSATIRAYTTELQGLSRMQANASLTAVGLEKAQRKQILIALEESAITKTLTLEQIQESLAKALNSEADAKAFLIKSGLVTQENLEKNTTIELTAAKLNNAVANKILSATDAAVFAEALGIAGVNTGAALSFDVFAASIWASIKALAVWLTTNPIGWAILATGAIWGLVKVYDYLTVSTEEAMESLENTNKEFNDVTYDLELLNDELQTTSDRIKELQELANNRKLSVVEQDELNIWLHWKANRF